SFTTWHSRHYPGPGSGLGESAAEVGGVGGAGLAGRGAVGDADADHAELAGEDVGAVAGAVHPGVDHGARRGEVAAAPADVLADRVRAARAGPAGALDAGAEGRAVARLMPEVVLGDHVVGVAGGGAAELAVHAERAQAMRAALGVEQAERRVRRVRTQRVGTRATCGAGGGRSRGGGGRD